MIAAEHRQVVRDALHVPIRAVILPLLQGQRIGHLSSIGNHRIGTRDLGEIIRSHQRDLAVGGLEIIDIDAQLRLL